jgi:cytochrome b6-f complex iron-sulfur subunit
MKRSPQHRVSGFVDDLLKRRRPRRFRATAEEVEAMSAAAELSELRAGAGLPDPRFVERLEHSLRRELDPTPTTGSGWTRRGLFQAAGVAAAAAVVGAAVDNAVLSSPTSTPPSGSLVPNEAQWRPVAALSDLPAGEARTFSTGSVQGIVVNDKGTIRALSGTCTHMGCVLRPNTAAASLDCPCHRTAFTLDGSVRRHQLPQRPANLPTIESRVREGQVEVLVV